jgi:hypothetical protein
MTPEEQEYIKNIAVVAAGAGVLGGALVSAVALIVNGWLQRSADSSRHRIEIEAANTRHLRELALEAAVADWKHHLEEAEKWTIRNGQYEHDRPMVDPLDYFLIRKLKMIKTFGDGSISAEDLPRKFDEMKEFIAMVNDPRKRISAREKKE